MTEEMKKKLMDAGRKDLIEIHEINQSGYAGINPDGGIVDRRKFPNAVPIQKNELFNIPEPKMKTPLQLVASIIWNISEIFGPPLGRFAPIVFGWMIGSKGKKLK